MRLKPRTIPVIALSSLIIASVLALTIFGFYAYLEWKEKNIRRNYKLLTEDINGELFAKYIIVNLQAKIEERGTFKEKSVVTGTIKNTSKKKIYSLRLKISFSDKNEKVVYVDTFYPIGPEIFLAEGDSISFTHQIKNHPKEVLDYLKSKLRFAKSAYTKPLKLAYKIEGLDIK
jgi:hypothetical protein